MHHTFPCLSTRPIRLLPALIMLLLATGPTGAQPAYPPDINGAEVETYKTAEDLDLRLWIFNPEGHSADDYTPAIVFFFGGGWVNGTPAHFQRQAAYLSERGMVAILADYRVKSRNDVPARVCVEDAKSAVRWIRAHASRLGIDPDRIAAAGGSAGGHLAASTATLPNFDNPEEDASVSSRPNALVLFNPVIIVGAIEGVEELEPLASRHTPGRLGTEPGKLSPYHNLGPDLPPTLIFHGTADTVVPHVAVELFTKKARAMKARCELVSFEGAGHGFFNHGRGGNKAFTETLAGMDAFLVSLGYLEPRE